MSKETVLCWRSVHEDKVYLTSTPGSTGHLGGGVECSNPPSAPPTSKSEISVTTEDLEDSEKVNNMSRCLRLYKVTFLLLVKLKVAHDKNVF